MKVRQPRFQIHRSQKIAAVFLIVFALQALWLLAHLPLSMTETRSVLAGEALWSSHPLLSRGSPLIPGDSILMLRCAGVLPSVAHHFASHASEFSIYGAPNRWLVRLPFFVFAIWLGAALWWVARRLFNDAGGFVALALYCSSAPMLIASATVNSAVLAAWGLFGLIFTAIGVAHTLYAPAAKWRWRILLLGAAVGLTAAANVYAAIAGLAFALCFMLYLAIGRRFYAAGILILASAIGILILLSWFAFDLRDVRAAALLPNWEGLQFTSKRLSPFLSVPGAMLAVVGFLACALVFLLWRRTRYFGTFAPLVVAILLAWWPGGFVPGASELWAVPFAFLFIGGIYADLLDDRFFAGRFKKLVRVTLLVLVGANLLLSLRMLAGA